MSAIASQITSVSIVYLALCSGEDQRKQQSCASLAFVMGNHRWPLNFPHKGPLTRKIFAFDDITIQNKKGVNYWICCSSLMWGNTKHIVHLAILVVSSTTMKTIVSQLPKLTLHLNVETKMMLILPKGMYITDFCLMDRTLCNLYSH